MTNAKRGFVADLDSTIYMTALHSRALASVMSGLYPARITAETFYDEIPNYYIVNAAGHRLGHDVRKHLRDQYNLDFDELRPQILEGMSKYNLVYDDAVELLGRITLQPQTVAWFVTVGVEVTQLFKLDVIHLELERRLGRPVQRIPYIIVEGDKIPHDNKGIFLSGLWLKGFRLGDTLFETMVVVEDHPDQVGALKPRPGLTLYQILHKDAKYEAVKNRPDIHVVRSLKLVQ